MDIYGYTGTEFEVNATYEAGLALGKFMTGRDSWSGLTTELSRELQPHLLPGRWRMTPVGLGVCLESLIDWIVSDLGMTVVRQRTRNGMRWTFTRT